MTSKINRENRILVWSEKKQEWSWFYKIDTEPYESVDDIETHEFIRCYQKGGTFKGTVKFVPKSTKSFLELVNEAELKRKQTSLVSN